MIRICRSGKLLHLDLEKRDLTRSSLSSDRRGNLKALKSTCLSKKNPKKWPKRLKKLSRLKRRKLSLHNKKFKVQRTKNILFHKMLPKRSSKKREVRRISKV